MASISIRWIKTGSELYRKILYLEYYKIMKLVPVMLAPRYLKFKPTNLFNFTSSGKLSIELITYLIWFSSPQNWTPY